VTEGFPDFFQFDDVELIFGAIDSLLNKLAGFFKLHLMKLIIKALMLQ